jgi:peptidyl-prolyl cis-trans isomerase C
MNARAVIVDGVEIPESLLAREVQNHPGATGADARAAAGHALAIRALLLDRARALALTPDAEVDAGGREETRDEALIRALLDLEVDAPQPSEAECRRLYQARPERFHTPVLYEASHILVEPRSADDASLAAARMIADRLMDRLCTRVCTFAELAQDCSDCPSGAAGGSLGQMSLGDLAPELEAVLLALRPGEIALEPVLSRYGWHILRLDRLVPAAQLPFELVEPQIRLQLEGRAWTAAATRYVAGLAAAARAKGVALSLSADGAVRGGSATLGDFLSDAAAVERLPAWLDAVDPALGERVRTAAGGAGAPTGEFVRAAMADFVAEADDARWTNLISAARDADDPALAALAFVLRAKLVPARQTFTLIRRAPS